MKVKNQSEAKKATMDNLILLNEAVLQVNSGRTLKVHAINAIPDINQEYTIYCAMENPCLPPKSLTVEQLDTVLNSGMYSQLPKAKINTPVYTAPKPNNNSFFQLFTMGLIIGGIAYLAIK